MFVRSFFRPSEVGEIWAGVHFRSDDGLSWIWS